MRSAGIEISKDIIKLVKLEDKEKRPFVSHYSEADITPAENQTWEEAASISLKELVNKSKLKADRIVVSIDSSEAFFRELSLPFKQQEQIDRVFKNEFANLIHEYELDQLIADYYKTSESEKNTNVVAIGTTKDILSRILNICQNAGIDPVSVDVDITALFNAIYNLGLTSSDENILIIYGSGKRYAKFILIEHDKPIAVRTTRFTIPLVEPERMKEYIKSSEWNAEQIEGPVPYVVVDEEHKSAIQWNDEEHFLQLSKVLEKEILRFISAYSTSNISLILLAGDFERKEINAILSPKITLPVQILNTLELINHNVPDNVTNSSNITVPLGLALKAHEKDALGIDLRKEAFATEDRLIRVKSTLTFTLELVFGLLALFILYNVVNKQPKLHKQIKNEIETQKQQISWLFPKNTEIENKQGLEVFQLIDSIYRSYNNKFGGNKKGLPDKSALEHYANFYQAMAKYHNNNIESESHFMQLRTVDFSYSPPTGNNQNFKLNLKFTVAFKKNLNKEVVTTAQNLLTFLKNEYLPDIQYPPGTSPKEDGDFTLFDYALK